MKTLRLQVDPLHLDAPLSIESLARAAAILRGGGLVAFPTETVYGLGANAFDGEAVARIFAAKQRPSWDPIIVHLAGPVAANPMLAEVVENVPDAALRLMEAFWPGPLTLLLPRSRRVPGAVTAGRALVGVRMPAHPVAFELIRLTGLPVGAPSANLFSHISPTTAEHVLEDLDGRIDAVVDAGSTLHGVESTVLDPTQSPMMLYRPGAVTAAQIGAVGGAVKIFEGRRDTEPRDSLPSPGIGMRHYAPRGRLVLLDAPLEALAAKLAEAVLRFGGERIGVMLPAELSGVAFPGVEVFPWGSLSAAEGLARQLYAGLRALDAMGCEVILCPLPEAAGVGAAIRDRLQKAAVAG